MANNTDKKNFLGSRKSALSDNYGIVMHDVFSGDMIDNLYSENSKKLNGIEESKFVRTNDIRTLESELTVSQSGGIVMENNSTLKLGDFEVEMKSGSLTIKETT